VSGRQLLARLELPEPWQATIDASLRLIDELDREITGCERELRRLGADHRYVPCSAPYPGSAGCSRTRSPPSSATSTASPPHASSPATAASARASTNPASATCAAPLAKQGPRYLRWALVEAATHACTHPIYQHRYQRTKARIGRPRGAKVAQVDLARRLAEAIWHMLTREQPFAPAGATDPLAA
jgi:transposase